MLYQLITIVALMLRHASFGEIPIKLDSLRVETVFYYNVCEFCTP